VAPRGVGGDSGYAERAHGRKVDFRRSRGHDGLMVRALVLATIFALVPLAALPQAPGVLHIKIVLLDSDGKVTPVPRHALLISDNPATAAPRLVTTALDGTVDVRLRPGNYTVESDQPVAFHGKAYEWRQTLDIAAGRDILLELTAANAEVSAGTSAASALGAPLESDPWLRLPQWQDSVVALWTPAAHASGFLIDASGLVATSQRAIGGVAALEVQLSPTLKVEGRIVVADSARDVAILRIDPKAVGSARPVPLGCAEAKPAVSDGQQLFTMSVPLRQLRGMTTGSVSRADARSIVSDFSLATGSEGGPVFAAGGDVVGLTTLSADKGERRRGYTLVVPIAEVCAVVAAAEKKLADVAAPAGVPLPTEPGAPFPIPLLKETVQRRVGNLNPSQISSADFDIAFITPVTIYGAQHQAEVNAQTRTTRATLPGADQSLVRPLMDFGNWSEYVADLPPVLLVRVTPKMVEGFWTKVARGAAQTQGMVLPPMKRFRSGFSRLRAYCGDAEVTAIHPFKLEHRVNESDTIYEGLYAFDPGALAPSCASVKIVLFSEKEPEKGDSLVVDAAVVTRIWQDFEPYRGSK
jgi:serine protease Do